MSGAFDFTCRHPYYRLRLDLVLREIYRLNIAKDAINKALHCAIASCHGSDEGREDNYKRMIKDNNIFRRILGLPINEDDEKTAMDKLIATWRKMQKELGNQ